MKGLATRDYTANPMQPTANHGATCTTNFLISCDYLTYSYSSAEHHVRLLDLAINIATS